MEVLENAGCFVRAADCEVEVMASGVRRRILGYIDDLMVAELEWDKGQVGAVHTHPHRQCDYIVKGSFEAELNGEKRILKAGDCFYIESNVPHGLVALEDGGVLLDIFTPKRDDLIRTAAS